MSAIPAGWGFRDASTQRPALTPGQVAARKRTESTAIRAWLGSLSHVPSSKEIMDYCGCAKSTASRHLNALRERKLA